MSTSLDAAVEELEREVPTDWRIVSMVRQGLLWEVTFRHQLTGEARRGTAFSLGTAAAEAAIQLFE